MIKMLTMPSHLKHSFECSQIRHFLGLTKDFSYNDIKKFKSQNT